MKQRRILRRDCNGGPQALLRNPRDILPVDQYPTAPHVIEAWINAKRLDR
jgi:hypothetical protein